MFIFDFENKVSSQGIHYSRYIASWVNELRHPEKFSFRQWLSEELKLPEEEVKDIYDMYTNGKLELEVSASKFLYEKED